MRLFKIHNRLYINLDAVISIEVHGGRGDPGTHVSIKLSSHEVTMKPSEMGGVDNLLSTYGRLIGELSPEA